MLLTYVDEECPHLPDDPDKVSFNGALNSSSFEIVKYEGDVIGLL